MIIVIGGRDSSKTHKHYDLCRKTGPQALWIESAATLKAEFPDIAKNTGITAGASTPDGIITEVFITMENFSQMLEGSLKTLHTGETVTGTVFTIGENEIKLDLGAKFTGVLAKEQITDDPAAKLSEMFKVGDEVEVFVIRVEDGKGIATVSKKRVDADNSWVVLKDAYEAGTVLEGKVVSAIKGGVLLAYEGNTVFVPASQTGIARDGDLTVLVGTTQKVKLLEFDPQRKKALGSIKVILNEEKRAAEEAVWATLEVGKHYMGTVKNLTNYGAFVDIGGVDGMVHNSELSWKRIKHPSQVLSVGQEIDVFIKELDVEKKRISLGYKTQEMDSWFKFTQQYKEGDVVSAKIVSLMPFGAFAEVFEDVDGLIHISRISTERINSPADVLKVGDVVDVKITEIDDENRKLALSIRALKEAEERAAAEAARAAEKAAKDAEEAAEAERIAQERADMAPYIVGSI
jgi:4-hydroxy-3-methylbut-2-enyl diphosphate reductase